MRALLKVKAFNDFTKDNDPYGEHDFGHFEIAGDTFYWKRCHGHSRDKRPDCPQVVIALVVTPDGLPLAHEVLPGNTSTDRC
jgi:hypothetical protein